MFKRFHRNTTDLWKSPQVGVRLQAARGQTSLAAIEKATKIYQDDLRALEENQWDEQRSEAVRQALLMRYANHLGLKLDEIVEQQWVVTWRVATLIILLGGLVGWGVGAFIWPSHPLSSTPPPVAPAQSTVQATLTATPTVTLTPDSTATAAALQIMVAQVVPAILTVAPTPDSAATTTALQVVVAQAVTEILTAMAPIATPLPPPTETPAPPIDTPTVEVPTPQEILSPPIVTPPVITGTLPISPTDILTSSLSITVTSNLSSAAP